MTSLVQAGALLAAVAAVIASGATLLATRQFQLSAGVFLDLLLAAALLRLTMAPEPERIAAAAAVLAIRKLIGVRWRANTGGSGITSG